MTSLWCGNIPATLEEWGVREELAAYGVRPYRIRLMRRRPGADSYAILVFASPQLAAAAMDRRVVWSNRGRALFRYARPH